MRKPNQCWITFFSWCCRGETISFSDDTVLKSPEMALSHSAEMSSPPLLLYRIIGSSIKAFHSSFGEAAGAWAPSYLGQKHLYDVSGFCPRQQGISQQRKGGERAKHSGRGWADWEPAPIAALCWDPWRFPGRPASPQQACKGQLGVIGPSFLIWGPTPLSSTVVGILNNSSLSLVAQCSSVLPFGWHVWPMALESVRILKYSFSDIRFPPRLTFSSMQQGSGALITEW